MGCLVVLIAWLSPRLAIVLLWIFSNRLAIAFQSFVVCFLGFLVLPVTTVFYALAYAPGAGVTGFGWFLVVFGFLVDLGSYSSGTRAARRYGEA
jgi:hypothetical protein